MPNYPRKITFGEMRETGERGLLVYCRDYKCNHFIKIPPEEADKWPDDLRISDLEPRFVCTVCGQRGRRSFWPRALQLHNLVVRKPGRSVAEPGADDAVLTGTVEAN
jgi:hypothetical protein